MTSAQVQNSQRSESSTQQKASRAKWTETLEQLLVLSLKVSKLKGNFQSDSCQFKNWGMNADIFFQFVDYDINLKFTGKQLKGKYAALKKRYKLWKIYKSASGVNNTDGAISQKVVDDLYAAHPGLQEEVEKCEGAGNG